VLLWVVFSVGVVIALALDLGVFQRKAHTVRPREAFIWSVIWVSLAILFGISIFLRYGTAQGIQFLTGYLIELSLSVDNVFIFAVIFTAFRVPPQYQHRVLFWGITAAVVMRGIMIWAGATLLDRFHWAIYVFGGLLIITGIRMFLHREEKTDVTENALVGWLQRHLRLTHEFHGEHFLTRIDGKIYATPLFLVMALVGPTDLMFALDSIPAVFAVTRDPFIVFTSNVFAVLGLRSMFFLLTGIMGRFHYLKMGLSLILIFVGFKMLGVFHIHMLASLGVIVAILATSVILSWLRPVPEEIEAAVEEIVEPRD
jgi:tellurite resistance protein TerC